MNKIIKITKILFYIINSTIIIFLIFGLIGLEVSMTYNVNEAYAMGKNKHCLSLGQLKDEIRFQEIAFIISIIYLTLIQVFIIFNYHHKK